MNTAMRKSVETVRAKLTPLQSQIDDLQKEIIEIRDMEQSFFDELPETSQVAEKGVISEKNISLLEDADLALDDISSTFQDDEGLLDQIK